MDDSLPTPGPDRGRGQGGHPSDHMPPGAGRRQHGRRVQPHPQRQEDRRLHYAAGSGCRERVRRRRPGLCRLCAVPAAARRGRAEQVRGTSELRLHRPLQGHHKVVRPHQPRGAHSGDDGPRLQPDEAWPAGPRAPGDPARCRRGRVPRRGNPIQAGARAQVGRRPGRRARPGEGDARYEVPVHQRGAGCALRGGDRRACRVCRAHEHSRADHTCGQERVPREPSPCPGAGLSTARR